MSAVGLATFCPAMSGAEPWTASKTAYSLPMLPLNEPGGQVAEDVAVEIFHQQNVELVRVEHQAHCGRVHDGFFVLNVGIFTGNLAAHFQEKPVAEFHDVGFVNGGDFLAPVTACHFERKACHTLGCIACDDFQAFDDAWYHYVLDTTVQALGVFAHDNQVDILERGFDARDAFGRAVVGKQVQALPQLHVDRAKTASDGGRDWPFQCDAVALNGLDGFFWQGSTILVHDVAAGFDDFPINGHTRGVDYTFGGKHHFGANTVARNQCHCMCHACYSFLWT